jgi:hypothetical protein
VLSVCSNPNTLAVKLPAEEGVKERQFNVSVEVKSILTPVSSNSPVVLVGIEISNAVSEPFCCRSNVKTSEAKVLAVIRTNKFSAEKE